MKKEFKDWIELVGRLRRSDAVWPGEKLPVEFKQTHISVLLLGETRVMKLKKPVNFGFLDYSTLERRHFACEREVELNRRLCPGTYLGVRSIIEDEKGIRLSEGGPALEYGVLMNRLPKACMLDEMVRRNTITESDIARIAKRLSEFHRSARRGPDVDVFGGMETIRYNWNENFEQAEPFIGRTVTELDFETIRDWVSSWLEENEEFLNERVEGGHVCDGHGDLRCESICVENGISIFDCIEFNERFRCADVAAEAAFLAMDLDAFGRPDLGYYFYECYSRESGDKELFKLFSFYRCYRAFVRGKVLSFQLDEPEITGKQHKVAKRNARNYFDIAARSTEPNFDKPTMVVVSGLSGTGKTSIARAIACDLGSRVVSSDVVRRSLFGDEESPVEYGEGKYDKKANRLTYQKMIERGIEFLRNDGCVILDATFQRTADRQEVRRRAESVGAAFRLIECRLSPDRIRERLDLRASRNDGLSKATWETYKMQRSELNEGGTGLVADLVLETDGSLSEVSRRALNWLRKDVGQSSMMNEMAHSTGSVIFRPDDS
ncbi:MAG: AAA family ATPase [Pyrinomonadaceae bacterium]|nr:AAA family ATPase [Pyrinomonadaceae bacterium]